MRSYGQIQQIKSRVQEPYSKKEFLSTEEVNHCIEIFELASNINCPYSGVIQKNTGPLTLNLDTFNDSVINRIMVRLKEELGEFHITAGFFFKTDFPHVIHNDDTFELPNGVYKGITLPLKIFGQYAEYPKLCFFDQFYFHGPAKFFNGSKNIPTYYNKQIYEYSDVEGLVDSVFFDKNNYFTHLLPQWLEGLSLNTVLDWIPGDALIFDSTRLHCASDFRQLGIKAKLAISIFTKLY